MKYLFSKTLYLLPLMAVAICSSACAQTDSGQELTLPAGFNIEQLNFTVPNARQMALTENGTLIVGTRREGKVYAVVNALTEQAPNVITLFEDLTLPSGVVIKDGNLYIGAVSRILRVDDIDMNLRADPPVVVVTDDLPDKNHHGWKYLKFGPDGMLYVPVGAPCNICLSDDPRFASLLKMDPANGQTEIWAHGIRNTVGFDWHPQDQRLWFTDNGRDSLGEDVPPEELNVISRQGQHFGYPFIHAQGIADPEFGSHEQAIGQAFTGPELNIQAHSAALGMTFYTQSQFPPSYKNALFIAKHGSWNRAQKVGYQVSVVTTTPEGDLQHQPFIHGWRIDNTNWGRPNDVLVTEDGSLLISDDQQGVVYRVTYTGVQE